MQSTEASLCRVVTTGTSTLPSCRQGRPFHMEAIIRITTRKAMDISQKTSIFLARNPTHRLGLLRIPQHKAPHFHFLPS